MLEYAAKSGGHVEVDEQALEHLGVHPEVLSLLEEAVGRIHLPENEDELVVEIPMGRIVGETRLMKTEPISPDDVTVFVRRPGREGPSRTVIIARLRPTDVVSVIAARDVDDHTRFRLITAFCGELARKEPWDSTFVLDSPEAKESLEFWCNHALISASGKDLFQSTWNEVLRDMRREEFK